MAEKRASRRAKSPRVFGHPTRRGETVARLRDYVRVSTRDQQIIPLQARAMRKYASHHRTETHRCYPGYRLFFPFWRLRLKLLFGPKPILFRRTTLATTRLPIRVC